MSDYFSAHNAPYFDPPVHADATVLPITPKLESVAIAAPPEMTRDTGSASWTDSPVQVEPSAHHTAQVPRATAAGQVDPSTSATTYRARAENVTFPMDETLGFEHVVYMHPSADAQQPHVTATDKVPPHAKTAHADGTKTHPDRPHPPLTRPAYTPQEVRAARKILIELTNLYALYRSMLNVAADRRVYAKLSALMFEKQKSIVAFRAIVKRTGGAVIRLGEVEEPRLHAFQTGLRRALYEQADLLGDLCAFRLPEFSEETTDAMTVELSAVKMLSTLI